jgi:isoquinoline 1-oxidoreductase beta subunit
MVAEELECNWKNILTESPTPGQSVARKRAWGEMSTGGSRGIRISQDYVRRGAAAARIMLMQAAANELNVPVNELTVNKGVITHAKSGKKTTYIKNANSTDGLRLRGFTKVYKRNLTTEYTK